MISPPRRGDAYPGRMPPVRQQWAVLDPGLRVALVLVPVAVLGAVAAVNGEAAATLAVLVVGMAAATVVYAKNRTDRHNAAVDRGEIAVIPDPHFERVAPQDLPESLLRRLEVLGYPATDTGRIDRFDRGWIVKRRNPRDVAAVIGDDGGWARFDPRTVTDLWAVAEYGAGRGREPGTP